MHLNKYLVEAPLALLTANQHFLWSLISLLYLLTYFDHSSVQSYSKLFRFDGFCLRTFIFFSCYKCSIGFRSSSWEGHSLTLISFFLKHPEVVFKVCFRYFQILFKDELPTQIVQSKIFFKRILINLFPHTSLVYSPVPGVLKQSDERQLWFILGMYLAH